MKQLDAAERVARRAAEVSPRGRCVLAEVLACAASPTTPPTSSTRSPRGAIPPWPRPPRWPSPPSPAADPRWAELADRLRSEAEKTGPPGPTLQGLEQLALLRHLQRHYKEEIETYRKIIEMKPANSLFLNNMAWTLSEDLNEPAEALKVVNRAIEKVGKEPHVLDTRGVIYTRLGNFEAAVADLKPPRRASETRRSITTWRGPTSRWVRPARPASARERARKGGLTRDRLQESERADWDAVMNP